MVAYRHREEAVNTQLALLISKFGVEADAETIHLHGTARPDVLLQMRGLRVAIEGKFADFPNASDVVFEDARRRVRSGLVHIAAAVIYAKSLRTVSTRNLAGALSATVLRYRIVSEVDASEEWYEGAPASLMDALRRIQETLTRDDIVERTAKALSLQLHNVAHLWMGQTGACDRLSDILGMFPPKNETPAKSAERRETAARVSALVLANALIFQEQLSATDKRVVTLRTVEGEGDLVSFIGKHWTWVWTQINYVPIFQLGERILAELPSGRGSSNAVRALLLEAQAICSAQAALRHDLMGRIYHWLLHDAKSLGTYYTSVPAATLLLKLALSLQWSREESPTDFGDPVELTHFKVADLACGTGTLLMACAQALSDAYITQRAETNRDLTPQDLQTLHRALMENVLHGYDVLPSAVHLTASTLALLAPEVAFVRMNLFVLPLGIDHRVPRLGSLDFLESREIKTQMALDYSHAEAIRTGASSSYAVRADVPPLDLCVMNPPFVSSRYGNFLFGSVPDAREELQRELSRRTKKLRISATAGLGAPFVSLADKHVRQGGRIAFVLPIALATGEAWAPIRELIAARYHLEVVVASHDADRPNFSENTDLSELLFVARKLKQRSKERAGTTCYVNLWRNPRSIYESLDLAARVVAAIAAAPREDSVRTVTNADGRPVGEVACLPAPTGSENWTGAVFAQAYLMRTYWAMSSHAELRLPGADVGVPLQLCRMRDLGGLGYDIRDITDAFEIEKTGTSWSPHPAFWNHDARLVTGIAQSPNASLHKRSEAIPGRSLKDAAAVWGKSGSILLVSRLRTNTHRVIATGFETRVLGNTWWSFDDSKLSEQQRKALLLWLNSTLGILGYYGRRAITESAWVQMKKPAWESMPVLDVRSLPKSGLRALDEAYEWLARETLAPIAQLDSDLARHAIDKTFEKILGLPSLVSLRQLLSREPGLSALGISSGDEADVEFDA
jgi:hypothetical protein